MRINAADTGLSRYIIRPEHFASPQGGGNPFMASLYEDKDSLVLSGIGERLRMQGMAIDIWKTKLTDATDDTNVQLMGDSISEVGSVLEQMKSLTILAEDESLGEADRMRLQIDMAKLQERLKIETKRMSLTLAGKSPSEISDLLGETESTEPSIKKLGGDETSEMLTRALERIESGGEWDIAERYEAKTIFKEAIVVGADGMRHSYKPDENGNFELPKEYDPFSTTVTRVFEMGGGEWVETAASKENPTLSEKLERNNAILLMDSKSAKEGTERLDRELEKLAGLRDEFIEVRDAARAQAQGGATTTAAGGEEKMDEGRLQAMLGRIEQERLAREAAEAAAQAEASGSAPQGSDGDGDGIVAMGETGGEESQRAGGAPESQEKERIYTPLGVMEYSSAESVEDLSDPRLVAPEGPIGDFFAKLERFFKNRLSSALCTPKAEFSSSDQKFSLSA